MNNLYEYNVVSDGAEVSGVIDLSIIGSVNHFVYKRRGYASFLFLNKKEASRVSIFFTPGNRGGFYFAFSLEEELIGEKFYNDIKTAWENYNKLKGDTING